MPDMPRHNQSLRNIATASSGVLRSPSGGRRLGDAVDMVEDGGRNKHRKAGMNNTNIANRCATTINTTNFVNASTTTQTNRLYVASVCIRFGGMEIMVGISSSAKDRQTH